MTKKHFIALANAIREHNTHPAWARFTPDQLATLADFCRAQSPRFKGERWIEYIAGKCGPNGGIRKPAR